MDTPSLSSFRKRIWKKSVYILKSFTMEENYFFAEIVLLFCIESCKICIERCGRRREIPLACITGTGGDDNAFFGISEMLNLSESQKMAG